MAKPLKFDIKNLWVKLNYVSSLNGRSHQDPNSFLKQKKKKGLLLSEAFSNIYLGISHFSTSSLLGPLN